MEKGTPSAQLEIVKGGDSLIRLENNTQMLVAVQKPRDEKKILADALAELDIYPAQAETALYTKPVGKDESGEQKSVEGLSIRSAESLANRWKNSSYAVTVVSQDEESVTVAAIFLDYENNTRHVVEKRVSRFYTTRQKQVVMHTPDRFDTVISANMSKVLREVILRSLPAGLKHEYEKKVRMLLGKGNLVKRRKDMVARFAELKVTAAQIETYLGKKIEECTHADIIRMQGLFNAIQEGEVNRNEAFKIPEMKPTPGGGGSTAGSPTQPPLVSK